MLQPVPDVLMKMLDRMQNNASYQYGADKILRESMSFTE